jgi:hypothetical protein
MIQIVDGGKKELSVSAMKYSSRFERSVILVETMVDHICSSYTSVDQYGLKRRPPSYEVWIEHNAKMITVQSLTREIIMACTDPDADTARKFQSFIEKCIRQGMQALMTEVH